jgi:hypothetical protein
MPTTANEFPDQKLIWQGALLGSIAHAIFVCRHPDLSNEQSWDGTNYNVQDSAGSRGTIAFSGDKFVAVFFYEQSDRNPFRSNSRYDINRFLDGLPLDLQPLAQDEALQYLLQEYHGSTVPVITSAFWGDGASDSVAAAESWGGVLNHGAVLVQNQLLDADLGLENWATEYALTPSEIALSKMLFSRKIKSSDDSIEFTESERHLWEQISAGQEGTEASRESFAEIGIILP